MFNKSNKTWIYKSIDFFLYKINKYILQPYNLTQ